MTVDARAGAGHLPNPCVFEGLGGFRAHISYSAVCHMRETAWMRDRSIAMGSIENFLANQVRRPGAPEDGFVPGRLKLYLGGDRFYHADWGGAALQVYHLTGDLNFVRRIYPDLVRYAEYFDRVRDRDDSCLYDVIDQCETGQEYSSRYQFVDPQADDWRQIRLKGVDATCYLYSLYRALAVFARLLLQTEEATRWGHHADRIRIAVHDNMWDSEALIFKDVDPVSLERSPSKAAVGFYPFMTDLASEKHVAALRKHMVDPETFATTYPVPSLSADDPLFSADAEWKGKRHDCPWNGRVWPMTNSHVAEALARAARTLAPDLGAAAAAFMRRFVRMMFYEEDVKRPNSFEHYSPTTGAPCLYRGVDDYQHSWVVDLILKHLVGIQPEPKLGGKIVIDPLPFGLNAFRCESIPVRGHVVDVVWSETDGLLVRVDGVVKAQAQELQRLEVLPDPPPQPHRPS
jgi:glycogen debranching enzyme